MIVSGRCHGPGCTNPAVVEFFCCEAHQAAWAKQFVTVTHPFDAFPVPASSENTPASASPFLLGSIAERMPVVREAVQAEMDRVVADIHTQVSQQQIAHTEPGSMVDDIQRACDLVRDVQPPEPVRLTRGQLASLPRADGHEPYWRGAGRVGAFSGVPVELVDTVEESTPYLLREQRMRQRFREAMRNVARFPPASATNPQVAPDEPLDTNPQVTDNKRRSEVGERGWLVRVLDRLRRTA